MDSKENDRNTYYRMKQIYFLMIFVKFMVNSYLMTTTVKDQGPGRVLYGKEDLNDDYPYVVALSTSEMVYAKYKGIRIFRGCTGSLVSPYWVITAAHCISPAVSRILYGDMTVLPTQDAASHSDIIKTFSHPRYQLTQTNGIIVEFLSNDIGLLLVERVNLKKYGKVSAVDYKTLVGAPVNYIGFGITFREDVSLEIQLVTINEDQKRKRQIGDAVVIPCKHYNLKYEVFPSICLASKCTNKYQTVTRGDSGGPVLSAGKIVGVASTVIKNNDIRFTPVSPFLEWIDFVIKEEENNGFLVWTY